MDNLKGGDIAPVRIECEMDRFENMVREMGVGICCEWFGHDMDSEFTKNTMECLVERTRVNTLQP